jgi:hypothetical protein
MNDQSELDSKYFIDEHVYNCPFCNRRHVTYYVTDWHTFDWTGDRKCTAYYVRCNSCRKESMHLSYELFSPTQAATEDRTPLYRFPAKTAASGLDQRFFYSVPTSFFVLDKRVPRILRELITEAEGCAKSNFLTGASACVRKAIYELAVLQKGTGENYEERIKSLKASHPEVDPAFFDTLLTIQEVTSTKVHEQSYDGWEARHLRAILATVAEILRELYVVPATRADRRKAILDMKAELTATSGEAAAEAAQQGVAPLVPSAREKNRD